MKIGTRCVTRIALAPEWEKMAEDEDRGMGKNKWNEREENGKGRRTGGIGFARCFHFTSSNSCRACRTGRTCPLSASNSSSPGKLPSDTNRSRVSSSWTKIVAGRYFAFNRFPFWLRSDDPITVLELAAEWPRLLVRTEPRARNEFEGFRVGLHRFLISFFAENWDCLWMCRDLLYIFVILVWFIIIIIYIFVIWLHRRIVNMCDISLT